MASTSRTTATGTSDWVNSGRASKRPTSSWSAPPCRAERLPAGSFWPISSLADKHGNGTLRITSRQDLQLHGLAKADLRAVLRRIHEIGLTTMAACGDVNRNVVCCPAPYRGDPVHGQMQWMAGQIAAALAPRTTAYREIWLDGNGTVPLAIAADEIEPLYGASYLPRKLKVGIGLPGDNCAEVYCQDIGLLAVCRNYDVVGYNLLVGGGMGMTPALATTFPALAQRMAYVRADQVLDVVRAIVGVFRDSGERGDHKRARLKYLVADCGLAEFKKHVEQRLGVELPPPEPDEVWDIDDHLGWHEQGDGRWFYGLHVPAGRIHDTSETRLKTALREICEGHSPGGLSHARPKPAAGRHLLGRPPAHRRAPPPLRPAAAWARFPTSAAGPMPASRCRVVRWP